VKEKLFFRWRAYRQDDILLCKDGALSGKVCLIRDELKDYDFVMVNEHVFIIVANEKLLQKYLFYYLRLNKVKDYLLLKLKKSAIPGLAKHNIEDLKIPLPPLEK